MTLHKLPIILLQESKIYGSHFKEITADAPKSTKITFGDSDED
jgi:ATP-dependent RNA helicase DBP3